MRSTPLLSLLPLVALAACARTRVAEVAPPPPALSPINAGLSAAGATWHLRAGLNVAALGCRGPEGDAIVQRYNALLVARRAELTAAQTALEAEYGAGGGDWRGRYDEAMTRLYNFFSGVPGHPRFCAAAGALLADMDAVPLGGLSAFAVARLPDLDAPFALASAPPVTIAAIEPRPPLMGHAAPRFVAPAPPPAARPRLSIDLSALPPD